MAVRKLATALKKAKKQGQANAFIQVELKECARCSDGRARGFYVLFVYRWLPPQCGMARVIMPDGNEKGDKSRNRLDLQTWTMAWDRYVLGAVALDQVRHPQILMRPYFALW